MASSSGKRRLTISDISNDDAGIVTRFARRVSESPIVDKTKQFAGDATFVAKKLMKSTGKAAWIAGTTFLILVVPLVIEMDREQVMNEIDLQQQALLGPPLPPNEFQPHL